MLGEYLKDLGLDQKERDVYLIVLEYGKLSPSKISTLTGITRTTVYDVLKRLMRFGFVKEDVTKKTVFYYPSSTKDLRRIFAKERRALVDKELLVGSLADEIEKTPHSKTYAIPKIRLAEHKENITNFLYDRTFTWIESSMEAKPTWWGFFDKTYFENIEYQKHLDWYWKQSGAQNTEARFLTNNSQIEQTLQKKHYKNRYIKLWKDTVNFRASQWIVGEYSIMLVTKQKPHYLIEMHDPVYTDTMREFFKGFWLE